METGIVISVLLSLAVAVSGRSIWRQRGPDVDSDLDLEGDPHFRGHFHAHIHDHPPPPWMHHHPLHPRDLEEPEFDPSVPFENGRGFGDGMYAGMEPRVLPDEPIHRHPPFFGPELSHPFEAGPPGPEFRAEDYGPGVPQFPPGGIHPDFDYPHDDFRDGAPSGSEGEEGEQTTHSEVPEHDAHPGMRYRGRRRHVPPHPHPHPRRHIRPVHRHVPHVRHEEDTAHKEDAVKLVTEPMEEEIVRSDLDLSMEE